MTIGAEVRLNLSETDGSLHQEMLDRLDANGGRHVGFAFARPADEFDILSVDDSTAPATGRPLQATTVAVLPPLAFFQYGIRSYIAAASACMIVWHGPS